MIVKVFSIYDSATKAFMAPFTAINEGQAKRMFSDACQSREALFAQHPLDFTLHLVGSFDDSSAALVALNAPIRLVGAWEFTPDAQPALPVVTPTPEAN